MSSQSTERRSSPKAASSISDAVSTILQRNYLVYESLRLKIVNYHALATRISSEVEELTGKRANVETIVVAIKRFSDSLPDEKDARPPAAMLREAKPSLIGRQADVTIEGKGTRTLKILEDVLKLAPNFAEPPNMFQLPNSVKVLAEYEDAEVIKRELSGRYSVRVRNNIATIIIRLSPKSEKVPGIAPFITEVLHRNGISILDIFYGHEEMMIIVEEKFGPKAFQVLTDEIAA